MSPRNLLSRIQVLSRQRQFRIDRKAVAGFCIACLHSLDQRNKVLSVVFVGDQSMRSINRRYRRRDYATDVLSFSYEGVMMDGMPFLGEIIIDPGIAIRHAARFGVNPERELRKLLVHGILHLLGYDHEKDKGEMDRFQARLLRRRFFMDLPAVADLKVTR